jgi:hypothetical protein
MFDADRNVEVVSDRSRTIATKTRTMAISLKSPKRGPFTVARVAGVSALFGRHDSQPTAAKT